MKRLSALLVDLFLVEPLVNFDDKTVILVFHVVAHCNWAANVHIFLI